MGTAGEGRRGDRASSVANIPFLPELLGCGKLPSCWQDAAAADWLAVSSGPLAENGQAGSPVQRQPEGARAAEPYSSSFCLYNVLLKQKNPFSSSAYFLIGFCVVFVIGLYEFFINVGY